MRAWVLGLVGALATGTAVFAAEPVVLTCAGSGTTSVTRYMGEQGFAHDTVARNVTFQVSIDFDAQKIELNGSPMVVRRITPDEVAFSTRKPGLIAAAVDAPVYVINRQTGLFTFHSTSGRCERAAVKEKLF